MVVAGEVGDDLTSCRTMLVKSPPPCLSSLSSSSAYKLLCKQQCTTKLNTCEWLWWWCWWNDLTAAHMHDL